MDGVISSLEVETAHPRFTPEKALSAPRSYPGLGEGEPSIAD